MNYYSSNLQRILTINYPDTSWQLWKFHGLDVPNFLRDRSNVKEMFEQISTLMGLNSLDDWYTVNGCDLLEHIGNLLHHFDGSLRMAISYAYDLHWNPWIFDEADEFYWNCGQRFFMDWLAESMDINTLEDWYSISEEELIKRRGMPLMDRYGSIYRALRAIYPETSWNCWRFEGQFDGIRWKYIHWMEERLNIISMEDWYLVRSQNLVNWESKFISYHFGGCLATMIRQIYPQYEWNPWLLEGNPNSYWNSWENRRKFADWLSEIWNITSSEDWYSMDSNEISNWCGNYLIQGYYDGCGGRFLADTFPDTSWHSCISRVECNGLEFQREYLDWVAELRQINRLEQWYDITKSQIEGWFPITRKYDGSIVKVRIIS
jgi:hypothetical protein